MGISRRVRFLVPLLVLALALALAPLALAQQAFTVISGGFSDEQTAVVVNDFAPDVVTVNVGDTITWMNIGFHTITFPSAGGEAPAFLIPNPDNPEQMIFNPVAAFPSGGDTYDGTELRNSGLPMGEGEGEGPPTYSLTFTAAGSFTYFCLVHPGMLGQVVVQDGGDLPMTPDEVMAAAQAETAADIAAVIAASDAYEGTEVIAGVVAAGGDAENLLFVPGASTVQVGESVTWTMPVDSREIHTITFLSGAEPFSAEMVIENPDGPPTIALNPLAGAPAGGDSYDGTGLVNSGLMFGGQSYSLTFTEPGSYPYYCAIHGAIMSGTVTVLAAGEEPAVEPEPVVEPEPEPEPAATPATPSTPSTGGPTTPGVQVPGGLPNTGEGPVEPAQLAPWQ